jgi:glycosyltransferase involved in cell wall biosynthesis
MPHLSIVVPVYKAEDCLPELYRRLKESIESITHDFEIIFVEDCGGDKSWDIISSLASSDSRVKGLKFSRNFGQHYGITAGLDRCDGDWVVVMDCDLQDQPEEIPRLYAKAQEGYDIVLAKRGKRKDRLLKRATSGMFYKLFNYLSGMNYDPEVGNFRIFSKIVLINVRQLRENLRFFGCLMEWVGFSTARIEVQHAERYLGKSSYTIMALFQLAADTIIAYSDKPLRFAIQMGFIMSTMSFIAGGYILYRSMFYGFDVLGWGSLMVSIYFIGGVTIGILGIIGIYLGKTFDESKKRPLYIVSEKRGL